MKTKLRDIIMPKSIQILSKFSRKLKKIKMINLIKRGRVIKGSQHSFGSNLFVFQYFGLIFFICPQDCMLLRNASIILFPVGQETGNGFFVCPFLKEKSYIKKTKVDKDVLKSPW